MLILYKPFALAYELITFAKSNRTLYWNTIILFMHNYEGVTKKVYDFFSANYQTDRIY